MSFEKELAELEEYPPYLTCPVCKELFLEPTLLDCSHTLCKRCIPHNACPVCREEFEHTTHNRAIEETIGDRYPEEVKKLHARLQQLEKERKFTKAYKQSVRFAEIQVLLLWLFTYSAIVEKQMINQVLTYDDVSEQELLFNLFKLQEKSSGNLTFYLLKTSVVVHHSNGVSFKKLSPEELGITIEQLAHWALWFSKFKGAKPDFVQPVEEVSVEPFLHLESQLLPRSEHASSLQIRFGEHPTIISHLVDYVQRAEPPRARAVSRPAPRRAVPKTARRR